LTKWLGGIHQVDAHPIRLRVGTCSADRHRVFWLYAQIAVAARFHYPETARHIFWIINSTVMSSPAKSEPAQQKPSNHNEEKDQLLSIGQNYALPVAAISLFILFGGKLIGGSIPIQLLNPAWQLRLISTLVNQAYLALIGLCLFRVCELLPYPSTAGRRDLLNWGLRLRRLAVLATLGFILLLPLQAKAAWDLIRTDFRALDRRPAELRTASERRFAAMEKAIREAPDAMAIQRDLTILRGPGIPPQDMQRPLPQLKALLLQSLNRARQSVTAETQQQTSLRTWGLIQECVQNSVLALALALGFSAFAQRKQSPRAALIWDNGDQSLLEEILSMKRRQARNQQLRRHQNMSR
jgi:hypothetical protein